MTIMRYRKNESSKLMYPNCLSTTPCYKNLIIKDGFYIFLKRLINSMMLIFSYTPTRLQMFSLNSLKNLENTQK